MEFKEFNKKIQTQFNRMCSSGILFRSSVSGDRLWGVYLNTFKPEDNGIFRDINSSEHNCNCCKNFFRRYGNIVSIIDGKIESIFSNLNNVGEYYDSSIACNELLINSKIENIFIESYETLNKELNYEKTTKTQKTYKLGIGETHFQYNKEDELKYGHINPDGTFRVDFNKVYVFNHFQIDLPKEFVNFTGKSVESIMGDYRDKYFVFKRAIEEIPLDTLLLVRDLINQGSLLDGTAHLHVINEFVKLKEIASNLSNIDNWCWVITYPMSESIAKFKNHAIGKLCTDLAEGKELNEAVLMWNKMVDPVNYNKAKAPITQAQINLAKKFVEDNGYVQSFNRRLATIDDIKASEILHINRDNNKIKPVSMFDSIKTSSGVGKHKRNEFDKIETISIDKFMSDILPTCTNVELLLENKMEGNLVNLTTIVEKEAKQIFKWNNPFSYTFNGNLAGKSQIKDAVKSRGGKTDAKVRVSIHFPLTTDDYDLHCIEPTNNKIYYGNRIKLHKSSGMLDLDAQGADGNFPPEKRVENLTYSDLSLMPKGYYDLKVNNYSSRGLHTKFNVEVEIEGDVTLLEFIETSNTINTKSIGKLYFDGNVVTYTPENCKVLESKTISKELWGLNTNEFHKVNLVCLTPNHWDIQIGNKHYLFMLQGCKNTNQVRGFHNEHLIPELLEHRKVLDVLGNTVLCESTDNQLAGVGFNATVKDEVILRLSGTHKRIIKVIF